MPFILKSLYIFFWGITLLIVLQSVRIFFYSLKVNPYLQAFQRLQNTANLRLLFAGDSTTVGTGASDTRFSVAGLFGQRFPEAHIVNISKNGIKLAQLLPLLRQIPENNFDIAILNIGTNNIFQFSSLSSIKKDLQDVLEATKKIAKRVIIIHCGDIGTAPLFIWPLNQIYTWRVLEARKIYLTQQDDRVSYLDLYQLNQGKNSKDVYAADLIHPNDKCYSMWFEYIVNQLKTLNWLPQ